MNAGAAKASGEVFLFLHADTRLPAGGLGMIREALADHEVAGGAFSLAIDSPRPSLRGIARMANLRTRLTRIPFGDQGIFVRREIFDRIQGFPPWPFMEDVAFSRRMKKEGRVAILREKVLTSPRRWEGEGVLYGTLRNWGLLILFYLGVSPFRLKRWYGDVR
ncbi:MAG: glycosyltransferase family 2 protein, partial [Nitrospirae bacterium]|nr:glycosyltransferase family 2 protein [Nitrospirota bacterium]